MSGTSLVLVASGLLLAGVIASKLSSRLGIPGLLVFLAVGMLAGSDGPGGIEFDNADLSQTLGVVALAYILFAVGFPRAGTRSDRSSLKELHLQQSGC